MGNNNKRESFRSSLGFILVSAGCAIGIGNVWKFPYVAGQNGGGVFVLFYLAYFNYHNIFKVHPCYNVSEGFISIQD